MLRFNDLPIWVRLIGATWLILVIAWTGTIAWTVHAQRSGAQAQAATFAESVHEMAMAGLTTMMITGTMGQSNEFLEQVRELSNVNDLRVLRAAAVSDIFGQGPEDRRARDAIELQVLESGEPHLSISEDGSYLRAVLPVRNQKDYLGKNCMLCHATAAENTVLGASAMRIDLSEVNAYSTHFGLQLFGVAILVSIPTLLFIYLFVRRFVTRPLTHMTHGLRDLAEGEADLTRRLDNHNKDEIGQAVQAFNMMMTKLAELIGRIRDNTDSVSGAVERLADVTQQTSEGVARQHEEIEQLNTALSELADSAREVAHSAQQAAENTDSALEAASHGDGIVQQTVQGIDSLANEVEATAQSIGRLEADSQAIGGILDTIRNIAEQTNLLALNAAIEAARAGESGRGFAVVADEVRSLAGRSQQATGEIQALIERLQQSTQQALKAMQQSRDHAHEQRDQAGRAGEALQHIQQAVSQIEQVATQIASAAEQQSAVAGNISNNVANLRSEAVHNADASRAGSESGQALDKLASELQQLVSRFRV